MAATPGSATRRFRQQVYVDVPPSPYPIPSALSKAALTTTRTENTPLRPSNGSKPRPVSNMLPLKREISEHDFGASDPIVSSPKKQKLAETRAVAQQPAAASNACPEFPNGFFYCHQCSKKRDAMASIYCSSVTNSKGAEKPCAAKYCGPCLKNRYGEDAREIRSHAVKKSENGRVEHARYTFTCPKCRGICNCWRCRKSKGLKPTGNFNTRTAASGSSAALGVANSKSTVQIPRKDLKKKVEVFISTTPFNSFTTKSPAVTGAKPAVQNKLKAQTQTLPILKWTPVPTTLDLKDATARFQIREFVLRFASVMEPTIPKTQLAELEDVGRNPGGYSDDMEIAPWVSEACVRSMVLGLLGMLADEHNGSIEKPVGSAIRDIRATGNNLNKIWLILSRMRDAIVANTDSTSDGDTVLSFPDPLPPPASATLYNTRITRSARDPKPSIVIAHSAQMIPVVEALIEAAFTTGAVREELDNGVKDAKEMTREVKDYIKAENEKWDTERKELESALKGKEKEGEKVKMKTPPAIKLRRAVHKHRIQNLENALKLVLPGFAPRFAPLGADSEGRVFWALSPGVNERKVALDFIASATSGCQEAKRPRHRARALGEAEDRSGTRKWSWFVVVWGKKFPAGPKLAEGKETAMDGDSEEEDADERWWGFYQPEDIRKVAEWIKIDARMDPYGDADSDKPLTSLVKGLNEYAALLEWRLKEDRYESLDIGEEADKRA